MKRLLNSRLNTKLLVVSIVFQTLFSFTQNNNINGVFNCYKSLVYESTSSMPLLKNSAIAYFSNNSVLSITYPGFDKAGNVKLNNNPLLYDQQKQFYYENSSVLDLNTMNWKVSGHKNIPNMNFIYSGPFPSFENNIILPDTINKIDTLHFEVGPINNADTIIVKIWDSDLLNSNRHFNEYKFPNTTTSIYILPAWFSNLSIGPRAYISIGLVSTTIQEIEGLNFSFSNYSELIKPNIIIK